MRTTFTALAIITMLAITPSTALPGKSGAVDLRVTTPEPAAVRVVGDPTPTDLTIADWARDRYERADLSLPSVVVEFSADPGACGGNTGIAVHGGDTPRIVMCTTDAAEVVVKRTLLHELAHVWVDASVDTETRDAFLELRGLDVWAEGPWVGRGSEHAAEIITWALMDRELTMLTLPDHEPQGLAAGYEVLTGSEVPGR